MASRGFVVSTGPIGEYAGYTTAFVAIACIMAASGGLNFGYNLEVSGGVITTMPDFLDKFFHKYSLEVKSRGKIPENAYCKLKSNAITLFASSLYLAGSISPFFASYITKRFGRKISMLAGGASFVVGGAISGAAVNLAMLFTGRILLGIGVGFANQAIPVYLSEMAYPNLRGGLNLLFQLAITIGILCANVIDYGTRNENSWGWRIFLGGALIPGFIMTLCSFLLPETPNSLIDRGQLEKGRAMLVKIRGTTDVKTEFNDLLRASKVSQTVKHPWRNIVQRRYRPQLMMSIFIPFFQQSTGMNVIVFYVDVLFKTLGFGRQASLYSAVTTGAVNVLATLVAMATVDRYGRRVLFLEAGIQMFICQVIIAAILGAKFGLDGTRTIDSGTAVVVVVIICMFVACYAWSWGPLGWLVPSEIFPLEVRSAGQSITVSVNLLSTFAISEAFPTMLCHFKFGIFLFFAGWILIMTLFIYYLLPETKNVPIEQMTEVWRSHRLWGKFIPAEESVPQTWGLRVEQWIG